MIQLQDQRNFDYGRSNQNVGGMGRKMSIELVPESKGWKRRDLEGSGGDGSDSQE
jgi:hypothetical protein